MITEQSWDNCKYAAASQRTEYPDSLLFYISKKLKDNRINEVYTCTNPKTLVTGRFPIIQISEKDNSTIESAQIYQISLEEILNNEFEGGWRIHERLAKLVEKLKKDISVSISQCKNCRFYQKRNFLS